MGVWSLLLIIQNVFYSEKTFEINKSLCINLSLKERGKAVQEPEPNVVLLLATALILYKKQIWLKLIC